MSHVLSEFACATVLETARKGVAPDPLYAQQYLLPRLGGGHAPAVPAKAARDSAPFEVITRVLAIGNRARRRATRAEMEAITRRLLAQERREQGAHRAAQKAAQKAADVEAAWAEHDARRA